MTKSITYKNFEISSATEQLVHSGRWPLRVSIIRHRDAEGFTNQTFFDAGNTFETKDEAERESIIFGRKIIDGEVSGLSADHL